MAATTWTLANPQVRVLLVRDPIKEDPNQDKEKVLFGALLSFFCHCTLVESEFVHVSVLLALGTIPFRRFSRSAAYSGKH
ncbi:unnamed protein product [Ilex paraguariensis]|uniref:Uncharacterized protein n=1 Tax=Ilex paraguariensis TaxID=185542 RepID=A0ABC8S1B9_9AQUA